MNIYQKLIKARTDLQELELKKTGSNQSIKYYNLGDFLPATNHLALKYNFLYTFNIVSDRGKEKAVLTIINASEPTEKIAFTTPTAEVSLPRGQAIQGLGAKITYLRRYMLMTAFEMVESDIVETIARDLTDEVELADQEKIIATKTIEELTKVCGELKTKYKISLITPLFELQKNKLAKPVEKK